MKKTFKFLLAITIFSISGTVKAQIGELVFKEGNYGTQNTVIRLADAPQSINLRNLNGANDEARSVILLNVKPGAIISVYDSPSAATSDDYCIITVKASSPNYIVNSFERSYEDAYVKVQFYPYNGLDGKVSYIRHN